MKHHKKQGPIIVEISSNKVKKIASSAAGKKPTVLRRKIVDPKPRSVTELDQDNLQSHWAQRVRSKTWDLSANDFCDVNSSNYSDSDSDSDLGSHTWPYFSHIDIKNLSAAFKAIKRPQKIKIEFVLREIEDDELCHGLCIFFESLRHHKTLKSIEITFSSGYLNDAGLAIMSQGLGRLSFLKNLWIIFDQCQCITDEGVKSLAKNLKKMTSLQSIYLDFEGCEISEESLDELGKALEEHEKMQNRYRPGLCQREIKVTG